MTELRPFDLVNYLKSPADVAYYLESEADGAEPSTLLTAVHDAIRALRVMDGPAMWRNGVTNTDIIVSRVRRKHAKTLRRSKAAIAFVDELEAELERWHRATRSANPVNYEQAEQVFQDYTSPPDPHAAGTPEAPPDR